MSSNDLFAFSGENRRVDPVISTKPDERRRHRTLSNHNRCIQNNVQPFPTMFNNKTTSHYFSYNQSSHNRWHRKISTQKAWMTNPTMIFALQIIVLSGWTISLIGARPNSPLASFVQPFSFLGERKSPRSFVDHYPSSSSLSSSYETKRASLFVTLQHQSAVGGGGTGDDNNFSNEFHDRSLPISHFPKELIKKLSSFSSNISRHRVTKKQKSGGSMDATKSINDSLIGACNSLIYFLRDEAEKVAASAATNQNTIEMDNEAIESLREILEILLVQAVRAASDVGDFILLRKLVYATVGYATAIASHAQICSSMDFPGDSSDSGSSYSSSDSTKTTTALLQPRIFGEAISSLSKTKASTSKVKALWNYFVYDVVDQDPSILVHPPSAFELNAMLSALAQREKVSAALQLYQQVTSEERLNSMNGDSYTASILFTMLADSISRGADGGAWNQEKNKLIARLGGGDVGDGEKEDAEDGNDLLDGMSPCWQWNEAMQLLNTFSSLQLNNFAYAALMKVNERATEEYCEATLRHNGVKSGMIALERMKKDKISPDVVTCSALMTTFDKGHHWKASVSLLNAMEASLQSKNDTDTSKKRWSLPPPNTFTYALAISTCARCNQGDVALSLLDQMTDTTSNIGKAKSLDLKPNTWVYNAVILACAESNASSRAKSKGSNLVTALNILEKMERGSGVGIDAAPDTVSYNTLLSSIDESSFEAAKEMELEPSKKASRLSKCDEVQDVVVDILDTMEAHGISRDSITYYNAILACSDPKNALVILHRSLTDTAFIHIVSKKGNSSSRLKGRAAGGIVFVANAALYVAAESGDVNTVSEILSLLFEADTNINAESIKYIIQALGQIGDCEAILALLICLRGQSFANDILKERYSIDILSSIPEKSIPVIEEEIYSSAITACLRHDELGMADQILLSMKKNGLTLNQRSLKGIIKEYCRMAMTSSKEEFKIARVAKRLDNDISMFGIVEPCYITSRARAKAALAMLRAVEQPSPSLLSPVAKACCAAGLWQDARSILRRMHRAAIRELRQDVTYISNSNIIEGKFLSELPRLHRSLLKYCAKGGNITPALNFADDIQFLASRIRQHAKSIRGAAKGEENEPEWITLSSRLLMDAPTPENIPETIFSDAGALSTIIERPIGLTGQDWKLILIAASRGGHWKVCLGTLPFIRPYVKETHPKYAMESLNLSTEQNSSRPSLERLNRKYERIARALTAAILCFESRSQYAWAIRAIDDWIEWSGRRPRKEAVASACRVLAKRYRGQEVLNLVTKVLNIPSSANANDVRGETADTSEYTYEKAIYTESINALHKSGLYEEADQLYAEAVANGHLPWAVIQSTSKTQLQLDLHGMSSAVAHSAVRVSLQKEIMRVQKPSQPEDKSTMDKDVVIITGRGRRSGERLRPILRPEVQRMLTEEFYPPLGTSSIPGNMGALLVPKRDINAWLKHQRKQKGKRLLFVADMLRDITSGSRLERALQRKLNQEESSTPANDTDE